MADFEKILERTKEIAKEAFGNEPYTDGQISGSFRKAAREHFLEESSYPSFERDAKKELKNLTEKKEPKFFSERTKERMKRESAGRTWMEKIS
ncbi:MAG: hypothetical protein WCV59_05550 [Parcubacteria group bacterium]|jgi:hypothetical protein